MLIKLEKGKISKKTLIIKLIKVIIKTPGNRLKRLR